MQSDARTRNWAYQQVRAQLRKASLDLQLQPAGTAFATEQRKNVRNQADDDNPALATKHDAHIVPTSTSKQRTAKAEALIQQPIELPPEARMIVTNQDPAVATEHNTARIHTMLSEDVVTMCCALFRWKHKNVPLKLFEKLLHSELKSTAITTSLLQILGNLADHIFFDKDGLARDPAACFAEWEVAEKHRQEVLADKHLPHNAELQEDARKQCEQKWFVHFFQHRLTKQQQKDRKYKLRPADPFGDIKLSPQQHSFVNSMLRKYSSVHSTNLTNFEPLRNKFRKAKKDATAPQHTECILRNVYNKSTSTTNKTRWNRSNLKLHEQIIKSSKDATKQIVKLSPKRQPTSSHCKMFQ